MFAVNRTTGPAQQLVEFAAHLRQMLQWTEKAIIGDSQSAAVAAPYECCPDHQKVINNTEKDAHGQTIANSATFCVQWSGKTCYLGDTLPFWLLARLARRPNHSSIMTHCFKMSGSASGPGKRCGASSKFFAKSSGRQAWMIWPKLSTETRPIITV